MNEVLSKYEAKLLAMKEHEEEVVIIKGHMFLIRPATQADIERASKSSFCMD
jgi:hypothetical protein